MFPQLVLEHEFFRFIMLEFARRDVIVIVCYFGDPPDHLLPALFRFEVWYCWMFFQLDCGNGSQQNISQSLPRQTLQTNVALAFPQTKQCFSPRLQLLS